jgi:hypothetical protein
MSSQGTAYAPSNWCTFAGDVLHEVTAGFAAPSPDFVVRVEK